MYNFSKRKQIDRHPRVKMREKPATCYRKQNLRRCALDSVRCSRRALTCHSNAIRFTAYDNGC
jgi:hypothetical protein